MSEKLLKQHLSASFVERLNKVVKFENLDDLKCIYFRICQFEKLCKCLIKFLNKNPDAFGTKAINGHYMLCPLSNAEEISDTCMCMLLEMDKSRLDIYLKNVEEANALFLKR